MTKEERFASVTIYLAKVVDHLQGNEFDSVKADIFTGTSGSIPISKMLSRISSGLDSLKDQKENE